MISLSAKLLSAVLFVFSVTASNFSSALYGFSFCTDTTKYCVSFQLENKMISFDDFFAEKENISQSAVDTIIVFHSDTIFFTCK